MLVADRELDLLEKLRGLLDLTNAEVVVTSSVTVRDLRLGEISFRCSREYEPEVPEMEPDVSLTEATLRDAIKHFSDDEDHDENEDEDYDEPSVD